ncbi:UDP-2,3-diacylglucosamine diphosphatase [Wenyingzhuangia sp. 2_MG-2023]|uniref:UDP-2,3-diacylglucosamine diphosphatase n=1 Tax=Wenyingzhuangia sp. 2_MG-2023 TaxID=3062639 RepID=UPI0026E33D3F|nr:UDP-2,3-diacylglucosamine diphosphatase [Wenyingzhuangia sp. 2_MG-2023]MDO6738259.1 UDP-2,3-diacylglucosamine diphosphatase [Wenyingzhuangia sp. 2_MG-2023]MDO6802257.1 UDP-2,3-diacylglucosamine diphosphatase [Wenyingzhuangia sp. 1_MG-2023]
MPSTKKKQKRKVDVVVVSDIHLGTYGSRAKELLNYLKTIEPKKLILNGDIIDIWQFKKRYFPKPHMKVIKYITSLVSKGTEVYYITGNHDEMLRKFVGFEIGNFQLVNKLVLELDGKKAWFFHGDVFDVTMQHSKWLAKLGGIGYDLLIMINTLANWISEKVLGRGRISFSKKIKNSVKSAVKHINSFEDTAAEIAFLNGYDYVVCGHIHQPQQRIITNSQNESLMYLNSGDWIENLTALEYKNKKWTIYQYQEDIEAQKLNPTDHDNENDLGKADLKNKDLFQALIKEINVIDEKNIR